MTSSPSIHTLISNYYTTKPNFATFISSSDTLTTQIQNLQISTNMPVHPAEEIASGSTQLLPLKLTPIHPQLTQTGITDQVAKESKDSTASSAPLHQEDTGATSGGSMDAQQAHKANPVCPIPYMAIPTKLRVGYEQILMMELGTRYGCRYWKAG